MVTVMLSEKDMKILEILRENCKLPTREISRRTGLPITTIHNRIKKLEKEGIIKSYMAVLDSKKIGQKVQAFIQLKLKRTTSLENFAKWIATLRGVDGVYIISGSTDILIMVSMKDIDALHAFLDNQLKGKRAIERTTTSVILKEFNKTDLQPSKSIT